MMIILGNILIVGMIRFGSYQRVYGNLLSGALNQWKESGGIIAHLTMRKMANRQLLAAESFLPEWGGELYILDEVYGRIILFTN